MRCLLSSPLARPFAGAMLALALLVAPFQALPTPLAQAQVNVDDVYERAVGKLQQGDYQGAIEDFSLVLRADDDVAQAYVGRATARVYLGDAAEALQDLTRALQLNPNLAEAYYNRGILRAQTGDGAGAVGDLERAASLFEARGDARTSELALEAAATFRQ